MCRFLAYAGEPVLLHDLLYRPQHSIIAQSVASREQEDRSNADGFGVGWYAPEISPTPAVLRCPMPAWSCASLGSVSSLIRTGCAFAHVRAASEGMEVSEANCHPFAFGPFLFMHNGTLGGHADFRDWARRYLSRHAFNVIRGTTDSECLFAFFLEQWDHAERPLGRDGLLETLRSSLRLLEDIQRDSQVREPSTLNIALTTGAVTLAARHGLRLERGPESLYVARDVRLACKGGRASFEPSSRKGSALIASERLFEDARWEEVEPERIVVVEPGSNVQVVPVRGTA